MTKQQLIKKIQKLGWGGIYYGFKNGKLININDYNEEDDAFGGYVDGHTKEGKPTLIYHYYKFEELPNTLWRR